MDPDRFAKLPDELIANILFLASTPSFFQFIQTSHRIYRVAKVSRQVILHHLHAIPGNKLALEDESKTNHDLFLLLRQRLAKNLYGANFTAKCTEYLAQDARIDPNASAIEGFDSDYFRMSLVFRGSTSIRHYTTRCSLKERIDNVLGPDARIMFLYQRKQFVAVLCCWEDVVHDKEPHDSNESDDDRCKIWTSAKHDLQRIATYHPDNSTSWPKNTEKKKSRARYRVLFFDAYSNDEPVCYNVERQDDLVPKHFTAYHRDMFAILWDSDDSRHSTESAKILKYVATKFSCYEPAAFSAKVVWPKPQSTRPNRNSNDDEVAAPTKFPRRISFFKEGRRLKLWSEGDTIPYEIVNTESQSWNGYTPTNLIEYEDYTVMVDLPFFGTHTTEQSDTPSRTYCRVTHLCLGVCPVILSTGRHTKVMYLMRSKTKIWTRNCDHSVSMQRLSHVSAQNTVPVARLWGWRGFETNLTGLETMAISREGTRIAFALWNKVLVYTLDPDILCEELADSDDEETSSKKKRRKQKKKEKTQADDFYARSTDTHVGSKVAELYPIVLDLHGAVAHKMSWTRIKKKVPEENASTSTANEAENGEVKGSHESSEQTVGTTIVSQDQAVAEQIDSVSQTATVQPSATVQALSEGSVQPTTNDTSTVNESSAATAIPQPGQEDALHETVDENVPSLMEAATSSPSLNSNPQFESQGLPVVQTLQPATEVNPPSLIQPQTSSNKTSPRKKEKAPESTGNEATLVAEENVLLPLAKTYDKPSHAKPATNSTQALPAAPTLAPTTLPTSTLPKVPITPETEITKIMEASTTEIVPLTEDASLPSKPVPPLATPMQQCEQSEMVPVQQAGDFPPKTGIAADVIMTEDSQPHRRKRVSEDELVILTDRGIQVWNVGSSGTGTFKRRALRMDESMKGKMPLSGA